MKFEYEEGDKFTGDKAKDLKNKAKPLLSNIGKDVQQIHRTIQNQSTRMYT